MFTPIYRLNGCRHTCRFYAAKCAPTYVSGIITHKYAPVNTVYSENFVFFSPTSRKIGVTGVYYTFAVNKRGIRGSRHKAAAHTADARKPLLYSRFRGIGQKNRSPVTWIIAYSGLYFNMNFAIFEISTLATIKSPVLRDVLCKCKTTPAAAQNAV